MSFEKPATRNWAVEEALIDDLKAGINPSLDTSPGPDPWAYALPPWEREPTGPDVGYMLRICSEDGRAQGTDALDFPTTSLPEECAYEDLRGVRRMYLRGNPNKGAFVYPKTGYIAAEWPLSRASGGIHGFLEGIGDWTDMPRHRDATWQIISVLNSECIKSPVAGFVRAPRGWITYSGDALGALLIILPRMARDPRLKEAAFDDDVQFWGNLVRAESTIVNNGSRDGNVVSLNNKSRAYTAGMGKFAIAAQGEAYAKDILGCAVVLNGGYAEAPGFRGDAIARAPFALETQNGGGELLRRPLYACAGPAGHAVALGADATASAGLGGVIFLTEYVDGHPYAASVFAGFIDGVGLKPGAWYRLRRGQVVEVEGP